MPPVVEAIRARFARIHGITRPWWARWRVREYGLWASPYEWFADAAAGCSMYGPADLRRHAAWIVTEFSYGFEPTKRRWLETCRMLRQVLD